MNLIEKARRLLSSADRQSCVAAGVLVLTPLAAAVPASATALFDTPTTDVERTPPNNGNGFNLNTGSLSGQVLDNGTDLSISGSASGNVTSGSEYTVLYSWQGNWAQSPAVGDLFDISLNGTADSNDGPPATETSWKLQVNLDGAPTPEYTDSGSTSGPDLVIDSSGVAAGTIGSASTYTIDLTISENIGSLDGGEYGMGLNIPADSFNITAVPEPSSILMLGNLAWPALLRRRRR
jgi:hypothetical protein